jgi:hypothetical protein
VYLSRLPSEIAIVFGYLAVSRSRGSGIRHRTGGFEDLGDGRLDALVAVSEHELDTTKPRSVQAAKKRGPERFPPRVPDLKHLALIMRPASRVLK